MQPGCQGKDGSGLSKQRREGPVGTGQAQLRLEAGHWKDSEKLLGLSKPGGRADWAPGEAAQPSRQNGHNQEGGVKEDGLQLGTAEEAWLITWA